MSGCIMLYHPEEYSPDITTEASEYSPPLGCLPWGIYIDITYKGSAEVLPDNYNESQALEKQA